MKKKLCKVSLKEASKNFTQQELADFMGKTQGRISQMINRNEKVFLYFCSSWKFVKFERICTE